MRRRATAALLLLSTPLAVLPLGAQGVEYATGTTRYRVSSTLRVSQSSPMGSQDVELGLHQDLTVDLARQGRDTLQATMTVDSISVTSSAPGATPNVAALRGTRLISLVSPTGRFYSTRSTASPDPSIAQILDATAHILPAYRSDLTTGMTWADTTSGKVVQQGMEVDRTAITHYTVVGDSAIDGARAYRVARTQSVKAAGSGVMQGTPIAMESTSQSTGNFLLSTRGVYLGGHSQDEVNVKITILQQNAEINLRQNAQTRVEQIR